MPPLTNAQTRDIETLIHPYTNLDAHREVGPTILEKGEGIYVFDSEGKQYIEGIEEPEACAVVRRARGGTHPVLHPGDRVTDRLALGIRRV